MNILDFLKQPDVTIIQALLLKFKPVNMDVLPLYIVLLLLFPPILWLLLRQPDAGARRLGAALRARPGSSAGTCRPIRAGIWYFNPFAWQLLFVFGAWCALGGAAAARHGPAISRVTVAIAIAYLLFAFVIALTWYIPAVMSQCVPHWLEEVIYPIDKTNLDVLRFAHFLALAVVTVWFIPRDWPSLKSRWAFWPAILCGQHSLEIFCLGVFLSFAGHFAMVEISGAFWMQILVSAVGILIMIAAAGADCVVQAGGRTQSRVACQKPANADLAGGEA